MLTVRGRRAAGTALAGGLCALALGACGGSDEAPIEPIDDPGSDPGATAELSKQEFIERADSLCAEANAAVANLTVGTTATEFAGAASQERAITQGVLTGLRQLDPPSDQSLERYLDALAEQVDVLEQRQSAASGDDLAAYEALGTELASARAEAATAAEAYGFEECGGDGTVVDPSDGDGTTAAPAPVTPDPAPPPLPDDGSAPSPPTGGTGTGGGSGGGSGGSSGGVAP